MSAEALIELSEAHFALFLALVAVYNLSRSYVFVGLAVLFRRSRFGLRRRVDSHPLRDGQIARELRVSAAVLFFDAFVLAIAVREGWIRPDGSKSAVVHLASFLVLFFWYEVWFYFTHRLLHTRLLRWAHRVHHRAIVPHPLTAFSFSLPERAILLIGSIVFTALISRIVPISAEGLFAYITLNVALNVLGHSHVEYFPKGASAHPVFRHITTPTVHSMHYERGSGNFGLFTTVLDRAFGTLVEKR